MKPQHLLFRRRLLGRRAERQLDRALLGLLCPDLRRREVVLRARNTGRTEEPQLLSIGGLDGGPEEPCASSGIASYRHRRCLSFAPCNDHGPSIA
jgi:hypothetical protein